MKINKFIAAAAALAMAMTALPAAVSADWSKDEDGEKVYLNEDGKRVRGFEKIDGKTYYFDKEGHIKTGWLKLKTGKTYYMGNDGVMVRGWQTIGKKTYYFNSDGSMKKGWHRLKNGTAYFLNSDGSLARNTSLKIDGVTYDFDSKGRASERNYTYTPDGAVKVPLFGVSKSEAVKVLELAGDWKDIGDKWVGEAIAAQVKYHGSSEPVELRLSFNSSGQLYAYGFNRYENYKENDFNKNVLPKFKKSLGSDYTFEKRYAGELYNWRIGSEIYVLQRFDDGDLQYWHYGVSCSDYSE